ncbi:cold-shock protein [Pseudomonas sp. SDO55104_S430]
MTDQAGESPLRTKGIVCSFIPERGFGFILGDDGRNYFVHRENVNGAELVDGQQVDFMGMPTAKGYKAVNVVPGDLPKSGAAFESPRHFIWTEDNEPNGFRVKYMLGSGWSESGTIQEAKAALVRMCKERRGNAVLNVRLEKSIHRHGFSNYHYTRHRFKGDFVNVQRTIQTTDQRLIDSSAQWEKEFDGWIETMNASLAAAEAARLVLPDTFAGILKLVFSGSLILWKAVVVIVQNVLSGKRDKHL